jgi:general stress protein 26
MAETMTREEAIHKIGTLISQVPVAMLTTTSSRGWLRSRPMVAQRGPFDGELWFLTSRTAAKSGEVRDRRQVNVSYASPERDCYVSIAGIATLVDDRVRAKALWGEALEPWFPKGLADPDLVLIRVEAEEAEYWDSSAKKMVLVSELHLARPVFRDVEPGTGW